MQYKYRRPMGVVHPNEEFTIEMATHQVGDSVRCAAALPRSTGTARVYPIYTAEECHFLMWCGCYAATPALPPALPPAAETVACPGAVSWACRLVTTLMA